MPAFPRGARHFSEWRGEARSGVAASGSRAGRLAPMSGSPLARALPLYVAAGLCLSSLDATAKWLVQYHALFLVVWARYAGQMLVATPFAMHRAGPRFWHTRRLRLHLVRSTLLLLATVCFFGALRFVPLAEGAAITYLAPIIVVLLSRRMLKEVPRRAHQVAAVVGFAGVLILVRPGSAVFHPAALLLLIAAACNALYVILTRQLKDEDPYTSLFYSSLVGAVGLTLLVPWFAGALPSTPLHTALFLLLGIFAGAGHWLLIHAFGRAPASLLAPFTYLQLVWATVYGWLVFAHFPDGLSLLGMFVVVASGLLLALQEQRRARQV